MNSVFKKINKLKENQTKEYQELINNSVTDYVKLGDSILIAKETDESIDKAIESEFSWEQLKASILLAKKVINKTKFNTLDVMDSKYYGELRKYTPALLEKISIEPVSEKSKDVVNAVNVIGVSSTFGEKVASEVKIWNHKMFNLLKLSSSNSISISSRYLPRKLMCSQFNGDIYCNSFSSI
jgi:hypothetical protein